MRLRAVVTVASVFATMALAIAPGCKDATQATLDVRLLKSDLCPTLGGTALAVGADRLEVESRISTYVTAETRDCDPATGTIGSLVVTPGEGGRSAVVVVVAFDRARAPSATACKPPAYAGCVVARRFFPFADHRNLRIPISIDPECVDVPCNATSTCRKGNCYDSTTEDGTEPGDDGKGGASEAGIVDGAVDGFTPDAKTDGPTGDGAAGDGGDGGPGDGGEGGPTGDGGGGPNAECLAGMLRCNRNGVLSPCPGTGVEACCDLDVFGKCETASACAGQLAYCCSNADCPVAGEACFGQSATGPGRCMPFTTMPPTCGGGGSGPLNCPAPTVCNGPGSYCCSARNLPAVCQAGVVCGKGAVQWCCQSTDCGPGKVCPLGPSVNARICQGSNDQN
ncbi:MAG: hypothetical protein JST00_26315 [Deltaproteobacteria bacterium]|nr:hypothetical protein [Deltaproteobacteria bacterium]